MDSIGALGDPLFIFLYWLTGVPIIDYLMGTFLLALVCVLIGEFSLSVAYRINRRYLRGLHREMVRMHNLSLDALKKRDKAGYIACNREANEAYGKIFFNMIALSAASLWPAFFALSWMQYRFSQVELALPFHIPLLGGSLRYFPIFLMCYILARILFKCVKPHLPYFRRMVQLLAEEEKEVERMASFSELLKMDGKQRGASSDEETPTTASPSTMP